MKRFITLLLAALLITLAGCGKNNNTNEAEAYRRIQSNLDLDCRSGGKNASWTVQLARNLRSIGWIGQNEYPDTIWASDSTLRLVIGPGRSIGWERVDKGSE